MNKFLSRIILTSLICSPLMSMEPYIMVSMVGNQESQINGSTTKIIFQQNYIFSSGWLANKIKSIWDAGKRIQPYVEVPKEDSYLSFLVIFENGDKINIKIKKEMDRVLFYDSESKSVKIVDMDLTKEMIDSMGFIHLNIK